MPPFSRQAQFFRHCRRSGELSLPTRRRDIDASDCESEAGQAALVFLASVFLLRPARGSLSLAGPATHVVRLRLLPIMQRLGSDRSGDCRKRRSDTLDDPQSRRRRSEKVLLPALRNPARYATESNQREADAVEREWDDPHRRLRRRRRQLDPLPPQLAYVYLPSAFPFIEHHYDETRRHSQSRATKPLGRRHHRRDYDTSSGSSDEDSSCSSSDEGDRIPMPQKKTTMRNQRMRSLTDMSRLQNDAATTIQLEYRYYRRRQTDRNRRNYRLAMQAQTFLDVFLLREVTSLVPVCLLEVLRETRAQEEASIKLKKDFAASLADDALMSLIDESIRDVFHDVLQAIVKSYLAQQVDLPKTGIPTSVAVATDILDNWVQELVATLLPEVLVELVSEYTVRQQHEVVWETLLGDELQSVASDAVEIVKADSATARSASLTKDKGNITTTIRLRYQELEDMTGGLP